MKVLLKNNFRQRVFEIVSAIPKGKTLTYGQVAKLAGKPKAARAVGAILKTNYDLKIPCHRVVSIDGVGGYNRGVENKIKILKKEKAI